MDGARQASVGGIRLWALPLRLCLSSLACMDIPPLDWCQLSQISARLLGAAALVTKFKALDSHAGSRCETSSVCLRACSCYCLALSLTCLGGFIVCGDSCRFSAEFVCKRRGPRSEIWHATNNKPMSMDRAKTSTRTSFHRLGNQAKTFRAGKVARGR